MTSDTYDPDTTNNNASNETVVLVEKADLSVEKFVSDVTAHNGDVITWTIVVTNNGPDAAANVVVNDVLPSELVVVKVSASKGEFKDGVWSGFDLASDGVATLIVETTVKATNATIVNNVNVTSDTYDPDTTNNNASNETVVSPEADLSIVKLVSDKTAHNGDVIFWTIVVTNNGPDAAVNVVVNDVIPKELVDVAVSSISDGEFNGNVWSGFDLASKQSATLVIKTTVDATNTIIVNNANVTSDTYDPDTTNNDASNETIALAAADLSIEKYVSNATAHKGDVITWTIVVTNNGPDTAQDVVVNDAIPKELANVTVASVSHGEFRGNVWSGFDLASKQTATLVIETTVKTTNTTIVNKADVISSTYDPDMSNNNASNETVIPPEVDLSIDERVSNGTAKYGDIIYWNITINNNGQDNAENVRVIDILPAGVTLINYTASKGEFKDGVWTGFDLGGEEVAVLTIATRVNATKFVIDNKPSVSSDTYDSNKSNNNASNETIIPKADLSIFKVASADIAHIGDLIYWTLEVTNNGPDVAVNAFVVDVLPDGLEYVSDDSAGSFDPESGIWILGNLDNGESRALRILTKVMVSNAVIINNANVTSATYDPNMDNNRDNSSITVKPLVDLAITIEPGYSKVKVGDNIRFTVKVVNNGPDGAVNTVAMIELPEGLKLLAFKPSKGTYDAETGIWTIGDLAPGEEVTLLLDTKALKAGKFVIDVSVECDNDETDYTNNNDTAVVEVDKPKEDVDHDNKSSQSSKAIDSASPKMPATGNPIVMAILSLLAIVGISLKRKK